MNIILHRTRTTRLYTLGALFVNGKRIANTVEDTLSMLEPGQYVVRIVRTNNIGRILAVIPDNKSSVMAQHTHHFQAGGSYISSRKHSAICMGTQLIPGALAKGQKVYTRLFDRIEKATSREEDISLQIDDEGACYGEPISHWL